MIIETTYVIVQLISITTRDYMPHAYIREKHVPYCTAKIFLKRFYQIIKREQQLY